MDAQENLPVADAKPKLLPEFLVSPTALIWLWWLPVAVMLLLNFEAYQLISGDISAKQKSVAMHLGYAGATNLLLGIITFLLIGYLTKRRGEKSMLTYSIVIAGVLSAATQVTYLWFALSMEDKAIPATVTTWIYPPERFAFTQFAFAMMPLFYGVLLLSCGWQVRNPTRTIWTSVALAVGAPVLCYLLLNALSFHSDIAGMVVATGVVLLGITMFVGVIRGLMLGLRAARGLGESGERIAILVVAFALPVAGLILNRSIPFPVDFQAWEVYALVLVNTAILLFASIRQKTNPLLSFCLLCGTLPFTLYFFVVFLPFLFLSIFAVIALGVGFLVLTPTVLLTLHLNLLNEALRGPLFRRRRSVVILTGLTSFAVLPAYFTARGLADKAALNTALDYVYEPQVSRSATGYPGSLINLRRALNNHRADKNGIYYPLLSDYYSWLVFDNLILPDPKLDRLEDIFFGSHGGRENTDLVRRRDSFFWGDSSMRQTFRAPRVIPLPHTVKISHLDTATESLPDQSSIVSLTLTLENQGSAPAEFIETLPLPSGVSVAGLRLSMDGSMVDGQVFEKKTALWVYRMIRDSERRDPALLVYTAPDRAELRVFPIDRAKQAFVEIRLLVPTIAADALTNISTTSPSAVIEELARHIPAQVIGDTTGARLVGSLPNEVAQVQNHERYLHLIIDRSINSGFDGRFEDILRELKKRFPAVHQARVTVANFAIDDPVVRITSLDDLASNSPRFAAEPLRGGLCIDLALAHALSLHRDLDLDHSDGAAGPPATPIFVVISRHAQRVQESLDLTSEWTPLVDRFEAYSMGGDGSFISIAESGSSGAAWLKYGESIRPYSSRTEFAASPAGAALSYWNPAHRNWQPFPSTSSAPEDSRWAKACRLLANIDAYSRSPGSDPGSFTDLVAASKTSAILTPLTSYIVVERSSQWQILAQAEKQKLGQNAALEFVETPAPPAVYVLIGFALWLAWHYRSRMQRRIQRSAI